MTVVSARSVQALLHRRPGLRLTGLLTPALVWLGLFYLLPLAFLLATAFFDDRQLHRSRALRPSRPTTSSRC